MPGIAEQVWRGMLRGPLTTKAQSSVNQWAGRTTLSSGSATVTVSTTIVKSDSLVFMGTLGNANLGSGTGIRYIEVKTISPGTYFTLGTNDGQAIARDTIVHWTVFKAS